MDDLLRSVTLVRSVILAIVLCVSVVALGCDRADAHQHAIAIPGAAEWTDCGTVLLSGEPGDWDLYLWGGFAASVLKKNGRYLLYYQGSDGYHDAEGTVTNRAIGVATSPDGIRFTKHDANPVLTFSARGNHEEGAVSSAPLLDDTRDAIVMYYGANTWAGGEEVNADARMALSADGVHFSDHGIVLDHRDRAVWGHGDEIFPIAAFRHDQRSVVYYIPNGTRERGQLGVAWTDGAESYRSSAARSGRAGIPVWGSGSAVPVAADVYALFLSYSRERSYMEVRTVSPTEPNRLSAPVQRYEWESFVPKSVLLDDDTGRWLLYYRNAEHDRYGVMVASVRSTSSNGAIPVQCES
jgi:hypothetical protein